MPIKFFIRLQGEGFTPVVTLNLLPTPFLKGSEQFDPWLLPV